MNFTPCKNFPYFYSVSLNKNFMASPLYIQWYIGRNVTETKKRVSQKFVYL